MTAVKASARWHPHIANQQRPHALTLHLIAQALNKLDQVRMAEVAALVGAHDLVTGRAQRQRLRADNTAVGKCAN